MKPQICIITGSTLGGAEYVAEHIENLLQQQNFATELIHGAEFEQIKSYTHWLIVTSTHGAGEFPDNIKPLFEQIQQQSPDLSAISFAVIGLGSSDYDTFCYAVNHTEQILSQHQAKQLCPSLRIDVTKEFDHDQCAEDWLPNFTQCFV